MPFKVNAFGKVNAMANISDQTTTQRDKFAKSEDGILGANRTSSELFNMAERGTPDEINVAAYNNLIDLYIEGNYTGNDLHMNPDFDQSSLAAGQLGYDAFPKTVEIEASHRALDDNPNTFGPNINTHGFNPDGSPEVNNTQINSPTFVDEGMQGFGSSFGRNQINNNTFGSYLRRKKVEGLPSGQEPRLGEYVDVDGYLSDATDEVHED